MPLKDPVARAAYNAKRYQTKKVLIREKHAAYYQQHRDVVKAAAKQWKAEHRDRVNELQRIDRVQNPEKHRGYSQRYAAGHKQEISEYQAERYLRNRERILEVGKVWRAANPDKVRVYLARSRRKHAGRVNANNRRRYAAKLQATPPWLTAEQFKQIEQIYCEAKRLEQTDGVKRHVDHIYPLKGVGFRGLHVPWNLQILVSRDNLVKHNKMPETVRRLP